MTSAFIFSSFKFTMKLLHLDFSDNESFELICIIMCNYQDIYTQQLRNTKGHVQEN